MADKTFVIAYAPKRRFVISPEKMAQMYVHLITSPDLQVDQDVAIVSRTGRTGATVADE